MPKINKIANVQAEKTKKKKLKEKGSFRALGASQVANMAALPLGVAAVAGMQQINKKLSPEQIKMMNTAADKIIEKTGLSLMGVKIDDVRWAGLNFSGLPDSIYDMINVYSAVANGKNAAFLQKEMTNMFTGEVLHGKNTIIVNREKMSSALFHEIGHAFNANKSKFWGIMQKTRIPAMAFASFIALFAAFSKKAEPKDGKELTKGQKTKNFIRNNAGYIAGASMLPVVAEEIAASIRGCKWANADLPKELAKKVRTANFLGAVSYIGSAAAVALSAFVATKVKDSIMEKRKAKFEAKENKNIENTKKIDN